MLFTGYSLHASKIDSHYDISSGEHAYLSVSAAGLALKNPTPPKKKKTPKKDTQKNPAHFFFFFFFFAFISFYSKYVFSTNYV